MKTKVKILVSIIAVCVLIAVVALGIVLVFTEPVHIVDNSSIVVNYTAGSVSANVNIQREDVRLYHSDDEGDSVSTDIGAEHNFACNLASTSGTSGVLDLGEFNSGQLIDKSQADTTLYIDVALNTAEPTQDTYVTLSYFDKLEKDANIKITVSAVMYKAGVADLDLGVTTYNLINGSWNMTDGVIFKTNNPLSRMIGSNHYSGVRITVKAELVSYADYARLDGEFKLALTA